MRPSGPLLAVLALLVVACGSGQPSPTSTIQPATTSTQPATTTAVATDTTTPVAAIPTSAADTTTTTALEIDVEFRNGEVSGVDVIGVDLGDTVEIWVLSDVNDELHVHGYDLYYDLVAGEPQNLSFVADVPGIFEVEVHTGHTLLFELEVAG